MFGQLNKDPAEYLGIISPFGAAYVLEKHTDSGSHLPECGRAPARQFGYHSISDWSELVTLARATLLTMQQINKRGDVVDHECAAALG